ncbi:MAG: hypothetical protein ACRDL9_14420, partial [Trebonia sp.]
MGDGVGPAVLVALGDGLVGVSEGVPDGLSVTPGVGVGPDDMLGTPDVAEAGWVGVVGAAVQPAGVTGGADEGIAGSADETAAAILDFGVACGVAVTAVVAGWHFDAADERGDAVALVLAPALPPAPLVDDPPPFPAGEPLPSVPPPDDWPPVSTLAVTCPMACRSGGTATVTIARKAIAASAPAGRSQLVPVTQFVT